MPIHRSVLTSIHFLFLLSIANIITGQEKGGEPTTVKLWYRNPAAQWVDGLPFGNGIAGGMVLGGIDTERIALNHSLLWREKEWNGRTNPAVSQNLEAIRALLFKGDLINGGNAAIDQLGVQLGMTASEGPGPYQPAGDLFISSPNVASPQDYRRELDLSTGVVTISYSENNIKFERQVFASRSNNLIVVRVRADKPAAISGKISLSRTADPECKISQWSTGDLIGYVGAFPESIRFAVTARIFNAGGKIDVVDTGKAFIMITAADELMVLVSIVPDKVSGEPKQLSIKAVRNAGTQVSFDQLLGSHIKEHRRLFDRVSLSFGKETLKNMPTNERLSSISNGSPDPNLAALYFNFGRYLMLCGSRKGGAPLNLQGLWNESIKPPWNADYHHDCNLQMNYWISENTNLSECGEPFFDYIEKMLPHAREAAKQLYGCRGIWMGITGDPTGKCLKSAGRWSEWTGAAAWLAQHFWQHWQYTQDKTFLLKRTYPLYQELAAFYEDFLVKDPRQNSKWYGKLVTVPSVSPENFFEGGTKPVSITIGSTMDFQLINEVFSNLIEASRLLGLDQNKQKKWQDILNNIPPLQIGRHGQLQEWLEDHEEGEIHHRHISHLYAVFPGDQLTASSKELFNAARVSLDRRLAAKEKISAWPAARAWYGAVYARMGEADSAYALLHGNFTDNKLIKTNLLSTLGGGVYQIDGNFAGTALIAEMLLQSHEGFIHLLPALPKVWKEGQVNGLVARGGFVIDMAWKDGQLINSRVTSKTGNPCSIRYAGKIKTFKTKKGAPILLQKIFQ